MFDGIVGSVLRSCDIACGPTIGRPTRFRPRFMRGRFRQCWGTALRERCRARLAGDVVSESRDWKLFCLVPVMLLHRPRGSGSVERRVGTESCRFRGRQVDPVVGRCIRVHFSEVPSDYHHNGGRAETQRAGRSVTHPTWPGLTRSTGVDRGGIGAQKQKNFAGDEASTSRSAGATNPAAVLEFEPDTPLTMEEDFPFCSQGTPSRSRWLHKRNVAHLSRRCRNALVRRRRFRTGPRAR